MAKKNSLVNNINRRKKTGSSRSKKKSTVSKTAYQDMKAGWPTKGKKSKTKKKTATVKAKKSPAKSWSVRTIGSIEFNQLKWAYYSWWQGMHSTCSGSLGARMGIREF